MTWDYLPLEPAVGTICSSITFILGVFLILLIANVVGKNIRAWVDQRKGPILRMYHHRTCK